MRVLAINSGSSSIKCALIDTASGARQFEFDISNIGGKQAVLRAGPTERKYDALDFAAATELAIEQAAHRARTAHIEAVAHRVVHGGDRFVAPTLLTDDAIAALEVMNALAPLHNPPALAVLRAARASFDSVPHVAVFDTAFHRTLPPRARAYALPRALAHEHGVRRYGFHGVSYAHATRASALFLGATPQSLRIVACHLGNGASIAAVEYGRSVETSMGMTPLEGLVMGTRGGDLDPGIPLELMRSGKLDAAGLERLLNQQSGLIGLTGTFDFAAIEQRAQDGDEDCRLAISIYTHRLRKYIGAYAAVMGGADAIVFTGGVGEHSSLVRHRACQRLDFIGLRLDEDRNRDAKPCDSTPVIDVAADTSRVRVLVLRADEQMQLAREAADLLGIQHGSATRAERIPVAVSARHAHLNVATIEKLFGPGYQLRKRLDLSQTGQYAAEETVALIGPRGRIDKVRLMGPPRGANQIEISRSDEFVLGVDAPVRISGNVADTPGITLEGPAGRVTIPNGLICAKRHIHMSPDDARRYGVADGDAADVRIDSDGRDLTFSDVIVRVSPDYTLEMHLDTDEANAAGIEPRQQGEIVAHSEAFADVTIRPGRG